MTETLVIRIDPQTKRAFLERAETLGLSGGSLARKLVRDFSIGADSYDLSLISLNRLSPETKTAIKESHAAYRSGKRESFVSHKDFWDV